MVRIVAAIGLLATIVGRAIAPALHGAGEGMDRVIAVMDFAGSFTTFLFAILTLVTTGVQMMQTSRQSRLSLGYRIASATLATLVVALIAPALPARLPDRGILLTASASALLALAAAREAMLVPRTRAVGVVLGVTGTSALLHLGALWLAASPLPSLAHASLAIATAGTGLDAAALVIALAWIGTRSGTLVSWHTTAALALALAAYWGARRGEFEAAKLWQVVAHQAVERLVAPPASFVLPALRAFFELAALALAGAALLLRKQVPSITGALALALVARPTTDVPLSAAALTLAALTIALAARDERAMWELLLGGYRHPPMIRPTANERRTPPADATGSSGS